jgi:hypothetical protein
LDFLRAFFENDQSRPTPRGVNEAVFAVYGNKQDALSSADGEAFYHLQSAFCRKAHAETFAVLSHVKLDAQQHAQEP